MTTCMNCDGKIGPSLFGGGSCDCPEPTAEQVEAYRQREAEWRAAHPLDAPELTDFYGKLAGQRERRRRAMLEREA